MTPRQIFCDDISQYWAIWICLRLFWIYWLFRKHEHLRQNPDSFSDDYHTLSFFFSVAITVVNADPTDSDVPLPVHSCSVWIYFFRIFSLPTFPEAPLAPDELSDPNLTPSHPKKKYFRKAEVGGGSSTRKLFCVLLVCLCAGVVWRPSELRANMYKLRFFFLASKGFAFSLFPAPNSYPALLALSSLLQGPRWAQDDLCLYQSRSCHHFGRKEFWFWQFQLFILVNFSPPAFQVQNSSRRRRRRRRTNSQIQNWTPPPSAPKDQIRGKESPLWSEFLFWFSFVQAVVMSTYPMKY